MQKLQHRREKLLYGPPEADGRVLIVSNRLPVTATREGTAVRLRPSSGGVAKGLAQVAHSRPTLWLGWDGLAVGGAPVGADGARGAALTLERVQEAATPMVPLHLEEAEVRAFYHQFCNSVLWPALHGWTDQLSADASDWATYRAVNRRYAELVLRHLRPGDRLWIHDYHLFLLPGLIRERNSTVPIAFFLHTPFPEAAVLRHVPQHEQLLKGILAADLVGFHTAAYAENFLRAVGARPGATAPLALGGGRVPTVKVHPMGVDAESFARLARDPGVLGEVEALRQGRSAILLGVDRLDYTKGIPQRLLAFEALLERVPRLRRRVSFIQVAVPSREQVGAYRDLRRVVEQLVARINDRFGAADWTPVEYLYGSVDLTTLVALYRAADVMVVTPLRDGLNLVAKEYVATRADGDGVLVLSRFAGAAEELRDALLVDPNRVEQLSGALAAALAMKPRERRRRMRSLRQAVGHNDVLSWASDFLDALPSLPPANRQAMSPIRLTGERALVRLAAMPAVT